MEADYDAVLCDLFGTLVDEHGHAIPGAAELLGGLPPGRWAIVTSCGTRLARGLVAHAGLPEPAALVSADDVTRQKPDPECYLLAAQRLRVPAGRCVVLEDSTHGEQAARAAGMDVIRVGAERPLHALRVEKKKNGTIAVR